MKEDYNRNEIEMYQNDCVTYSRLYPDGLIGVFGDNHNEEVERGNNDLETTKARTLGKNFRDYLCRKLKSENMERPEPKIYKRKKLSTRTITNHTESI